MSHFERLTEYVARMSNGKVVLWCYLIWYVNTLAHHFDPLPSIWLNSAGISLLIGFALVLSVGGVSQALIDRWQTFRLFLMPFCVSSFSSLIKGKGFILVFSPSWSETATSLGLCVSFVVIVLVLRRFYGAKSA